VTLQQSLFDRSPQLPPPAPPRRNLTIEAGAGTGKTTTIVAEVLRLMLGDELLSPERIVLMTFTEKAAGEIADRIRAALTELDARFAANAPRIIWPDSPRPLLEIDPANRESARRACAAQLARIHLLRSQTIHSFCQSLLRQFPIEAGLDPQFKIIEGFERTLLYGQLYDAWIDEETRSTPTPGKLREWEVLLAHAGYLFQIRDMVFSLVDRRDLLIEPGYNLGDLSSIVDELRAALITVRGGDHAIGRYVASAQMPPRDASMDEWIDYLGPAANAIRTANLTKIAKDQREAVKTLRAGSSGDSIYDRLVSARAADALYAVAKRFVDFLDREKRARGVVDFDDLLLRTVAVLDDPSVLERARRQYDFIFVDEFQDTDRTQAKIIDRLARDASGRYVEGRTMIVGDPKQSIYGFRRADPETYFQMRERLQREGAEPRQLGDNYRSDAPLLAAVNAMFARLFPAEGPHDPNVFRPSYLTLQAAKPQLSRELDARITLLHSEHDDAADRYIAEAEAIAKWIGLRSSEVAELRSAAEPRNPATPQPHNLSRFAILFRRMTRIDDYLDVLDRHGIAYVLPPTRNFLDRRAPVDLVAVLRAIAYSFDKGAQISAARTPYFALTDEEIARESDEWRAVQDAIARYREAARTLTVTQLIDLLADTTSIEAIYDATTAGERARRHLDHVRALAFEYDQKIGGSVAQFVDEIARRRAVPDEMEPLLADEQTNAVRILTVHAAKGLEFDTVIIPDLAFSSGSEGTQIFTVEEPKSLVLCAPDSLSAQFRRIGDEKLKRVATWREEAETRRLFYVAVTRAKAEVVFVCNTMKAVKKSSFAACIDESLGITLRDMNWPDGRQVQMTPVATIALEKVSSAEAPGERARAKRLIDAELERQLTTSDIVPASIVSPAVPPRPLDIHKTRAAAQHREGGILIHRVLELWDGAGPVETMLNAAAAEMGASADAINRARMRLAKLASSPTMQQIAAAETIARELPIRYTDASGAVLTRRVDRLIRENGCDIVIDYKTGAPKPRDEEQVREYCTAISAMTGRECTSLIWYLDEDAVVSQLAPPPSSNHC
jgi:ATP-dependent helicase/nuclease subunit A